jgi:peroxiredoxin
VKTGAGGAQVQALFDPDVVFDIAGRTLQGRDAVLARLSGMSGNLKEAEWQVLPTPDVHTAKVRAVIPGRTIPSRGGPMSAVDMLFVLNAAGKISRVTPHPHHLEPADLRPTLGVGEVAPDFSLPDVSGAFTSLRVDSAAVTLVIFTCNQCPWALGWHDRLQAVIRDYVNRGVRALQINSNDSEVSINDALEVSRRRVDNGEFSSVYLIDVGQKVARRWGARHTPEVFALDAAGRVAYHGAPDADSQNEALSAQWVRDALDALLAAREVPRAQTDPVGCTIKWTL